MDAYIIAIVGEGSECRVRILDMSETAVVHVHDYLLPRVKQAVSDGAIQLHDVTCKNNRLLYCGIPIRDCVPNLKSDKSHTKKLVAIRTIYRDTGIHEVIVSDDHGNFKKASLAALMNDYEEFVTNIESKEVDALGRYTAYPKGNGFCVAIKPNGEMLESIGIPQMVELSADEDPLYSNWIDTEYFASEMTSRNMKYTFNKSTGTLEYIEPHGNILNIPVGVTNISELHAPDGVDVDEFCKAASLVDTVRIPSTVYNIEDNAFRRFENVTNIIWQPGEYTDLSVSGLRYIYGKGITDLAKLLPINIPVIRGLQSNEDIFGIDFTPFTNLRSITNSFNLQYGKIRGPIIIPDSVEHLQYCFTNCEVCGNLAVKMPAELKTLQSTIRDVKVAEGAKLIVDFSKASKLETIEYRSLYNVRGIHQLDFSNCVSLTKIRESVSKLPDLCDLILPPNIVDIAYEAFMECPNINKVDLPESCASLGSRSFNTSNIESFVVHPTLNAVRGLSKCTELIIEPRVSIPSEFLTSAEFKGAEIPDTVTVLESSAFSYARLDNIKLPSSIIKIYASAFQMASGKILDMYDWKVEEIPYSCFYMCSINRIALPKTTKVIKDSAFANSASLSAVYIGSAVVDLDKGAVSKIGEKVPGGTEFFVVEDSYAHKFLRRIRKTVRVFSSDDEAYETLIGKEHISSERAITKAKILTTDMDDPVIRAIMDPRYISNVQFLTKMYDKLCNDKIKPCDANVRLNTTNLRKLMRCRNFADAFDSSYSDTKMLFEPICTEGAVPASDKVLNTKFKNMCNIISNYSSLYNRIFTPDGAKKFAKMLDNNPEIIGGRHTIYRDSYGAILCLDLKSPKTGIESRLWIIKLGDSIVYATLDTVNGESNITISDFHEIIRGCQLEKEQNEDNTSEHTDVESFLKAGDKLIIHDSGNSRISGVDIPNELYKIMISAIMNDFKLIGFRASSELKSYTLGDAVVMSNTTGKVYVCSSKISSGNGNVIKGLRRVNFLSIKSVCSTDKLSKEAIDIMSKYAFVDEESKILNQCLFGDDEIQSLKNNDGAYDELEPCIEWQISQALNQVKIQSFEELGSKAIELILNTVYYSKTRRKLADITKNSEYQRTRLADGGILCEYYIDGRVSSINAVGCRGNLVSYLIKPGDAEQTSVTCYMSAKPMANNAYSIIQMCDATKNPSGYVDNSVSLTDSDFFTIWKYGGTSHGYTISFTVNKATGIAYITAGQRYNEGPVVTLFRFRDINEMLPMLTRFYKCTSGVKNTSEDFELLDNLSDLGASLLRNDPGLARVYNPMRDFRNLILKGYPNGYKAIGKHSELFDMFAKQP